MAQTTKSVLGILCYLSFSVASYFKDGFFFPYGLMYFIAFVTLA